MINKISLVYFSPTNTSEKIATTIALGIGIKNTECINLANSKISYVALKDELTIFASPVYGGRIPEIAANRLNNIKGDKSPAIIVVVYGNRNYDDALLELQDIVSKLGFVPIAGAAFIGEHSFSTNVYPIAIGRPDNEDIDKAFSFGHTIGNLIKNDYKFNKSLHLPGNFPFKEKSNKPQITPITVDNQCNKCAICVSLCPTGAIQMNDTPETNPSLCILCCACIKGCPNNARINNNEYVLQKQQWLFKNCVNRKEPVTFGI